jgi:hypothetical protein
MNGINIFFFFFETNGHFIPLQNNITKSHTKTRAHPKLSTIIGEGDPIPNWYQYFQSW